MRYRKPQETPAAMIPLAASMESPDEGRGVCISETVDLVFRSATLSFKNLLDRTYIYYNIYT